MNTLTVAQVASKIQMSVNTVWRWARENKIPRPFQIEGASRWDEADIDNWLKQKKVQSLAGEEGPEGGAIGEHQA